MSTHFDLIQVQIVTYQIKLLWQKCHRLRVDWEEGNHPQILQCYAEIKLLKGQLLYPT